MSDRLQHHDGLYAVNCLIRRHLSRIRQSPLRRPPGSSVSCAPDCPAGCCPNSSIRCPTDSAADCNPRCLPGCGPGCLFRSSGGCPASCLSDSDQDGRPFCRPGCFLRRPVRSFVGCGVDCCPSCSVGCLVDCSTGCSLARDGVRYPRVWLLCAGADRRFAPTCSSC